MKCLELSGIGLSLLLVSSVFAGDWAHWRGPEMNGISREKNLVDTWNPQTGENVLWTSDIGGRAAPIVLNDRVYLNCRTHHDFTDPEERIHAQDQVVCWDANTGEVLWQDTFNVFQTDIPSPRVGWASMVGDPETGNVYVHAVSGLFRCYTPDGKIVWEHSLTEEYGRVSGYGGRTQTPLIDEDRIIVSFFGLNWGETKAPPPTQTFYAFDKKTGQLQWVSGPGSAPHDTNYSSPIVTVLNGQRMLIAGNADGGVTSINARTGVPIWNFRMSKRGLNAAAVTDGKYVYIAHGEDNIDNVEFGRVQCIDPTGSGDVTDTHSVWRVDDIKAGYASPLVHDGILYILTDTGKLVAFDAPTGKELWTHSLGTVGKGSPVWADGKIYVMEVNGNIHILKPSREKCETLSHVQLLATKAKGTDEIYGSPAISNGKVFFCTRDRMICIGKKDHEVVSDPIPEMAKEVPAGEEIATLHLIPYEVAISESGSVDYELRAYDKNGIFLKNLEFELEPQDDLPIAKAQGTKLVVEGGDKGYGGHVVAKSGEHTAKARILYFPPGDWKWDFNDFSGTQVPVNWINAFLKLKPTEIDGQIALRNTRGPGAPSSYIWMGPPSMRNYTVQADVLMKEERRQLPSPGITMQRYNLILKGNAGKLVLQTWAAQIRMDKEVRFRSDPDVWYTLKGKVEKRDDGWHVLGKAWKRGEEEPAEWMLDALDPHPNEHGSPGLYMYSMAPSFFDNISVTRD